MGSTKPPTVTQIPVDFHTPVEVRRRRSRRRWAAFAVILFVSPCVGTCVLYVMGLGMLALNPEFDGARDLGQGYKLWMLKGYPRFIQNESIPQVRVPIEMRKDPPEFSIEVGRYAVVGQFIVGELGRQRGVATKYFLIDTSQSTAHVVALRSEWEAMLRQHRVDPGVKLHW